VIVIETARLRLRQLHLGDAAFVLELLTDPDFLANVGDRGVTDLDSARRYIAEGPIASYQRFGFGLYLVESKDTAAALGMCGLLRRDSHPDIEIGFALLPRARRHGYTLEAARATLQWAVATLKLQRIVGLTAMDNVGSIHILELLGFKFARFAQLTAGGTSRLFVFEAGTTA
jgi:[ribosomal protein S5]-alanine N-acetyltransferase